MVAKNNYIYPDEELYNYVINTLNAKGVTMTNIAEQAYRMQKRFYPELTVDDYAKQVPKVLKKRDVLNILAVGLALDEVATKKQLPQPLQEIVEHDAGIFGVDELLALCIAQMFGGLSISNTFYMDIAKQGIAKELDHAPGVNVFIDDLISALAGAVIARNGHGKPLGLSGYETKLNYK